MNGAGGGADDPRLRFRSWVERVLVYEAWLDTSRPDAQQASEAIRAHQEAIADQADDDGELWLVEVFDPSLPPDRCYVRFGTDARGMVAPERATAANVKRAIETLYLPEPDT